MSSSLRTGALSEARVALPIIEDLAREVLKEADFAWTEQVSRELLGGPELHEVGVAQIVVLVGVKPSRPLYYLGAYHAPGLPRHTRDVIRSAGDYVDLLVKELASEMIGSNARRRSLGSNASALLERGPVKDQTLFQRLVRFNEFLYVPAKHDFTLPPGRHHRFTLREALLAIQVGMALGRQILAISKSARDAVEKDNDYSTGRSGGNARWTGVEYVAPRRERTAPNDHMTR